VNGKDQKQILRYAQDDKQIKATGGRMLVTGDQNPFPDWFFDSRVTSYELRVTRGSLNA